MAITQTTEMDGESFDTDQSDTTGRDPPPSRQGRESTTASAGSGAEAETSTCTCPECGGKVTTDGHERVCRSCGLVVGEDAVDHGPEWRNFDDQRSDPRRAEPIKLLHHDNGIGTEGFRTDGGATDFQSRRMAQLSKWSEDKKSRNLRAILSDLKRAGSTLEVSDTVQNIGCKLLKQFHSGRNHQGHSLDVMVATTLYAACRICDAGVTADDVAAQLDVERKQLLREIPRLKDTVDTPIPVEMPSDFVPRFVADLDGSTQTETAARQLAAEIEDSGLLLRSGCKPSGIAASIVYVAFKMNSDDVDHTQIEVSEVSGVSPPTIRSNKEKIKASDIDLPFDGEEVPICE